MLSCCYKEVALCRLAFSRHCPNFDFLSQSLEPEVVGLLPADIIHVSCRNTILQLEPSLFHLFHPFHIPSIANRHDSDWILCLTKLQRGKHRGLQRGLRPAQSGRSLPLPLGLRFVPREATATTEQLLPSLGTCLCVFSLGFFVQQYAFRKPGIVYLSGLPCQ